MIKRVFDSNIIIYATILCLLTLLYVRNVLEINISMQGILMISIIPAFFANPSQMIAMVMAFLPMTVGFQYKYALMGYLALGCIRFGSKMSISRLTYPLLLMIIWELVHLAGEEFEMTEVLRSFSEIIFLWFVSSLNMEKLDISLIVRSLSISLIGVTCIMIYMQSNLVVGDIVDVMSQGYGEYRLGFDNSERDTEYGMNFNPNILGFICNLSIAGLMVLIKIKKSQICDWIALVVCILIGVLTLSRAYIVCLSFLLFSFVIFDSRTIKYKVLSLFVLGSLLVMVIWLIAEYMPDVVTNFIARFMVDDTTGGRIDLLEFYNSHISSSLRYLLFGLGLYNLGGKVVTLYGPGTKVCHNGFQELVVVWGIPGLIIFLFLIYQLIKQASKWNSQKVYFSFVPLILVMLNSMADQLIRSEVNLLALILAYVVMCIPSNFFKRNKDSLQYNS